MKYFTKDMWKGLENSRRYKELKVKWENAIIEYDKEFYNIKNRMSTEVFDFFSKFSLHDSTVCSINITDEYNNNYSRNKEIIKQPINLVIKIISGYQQGIFIIKYNNIIKLNINYSIENLLFDGHSYDGLGIIGYDELVKEDNEYLKHEYLFSTGSSIEIVFKDIEVSINESSEDFD